MSTVAALATLEKILDISLVVSTLMLNNREIEDEYAPMRARVIELRMAAKDRELTLEEHAELDSMADIIRSERRAEAGKYLGK